MENDTESKTGYKAIRFPDEASYIRAFGLIHLLNEEQPLSYNPVSQGEDLLAILMPTWSCKKIADFLQSNQLPFIELKVIGMSDLPMEERKRLRQGLKLNLLLSQLDILLAKGDN